MWGVLSAWDEGMRVIHKRMIASLQVGVLSQQGFSISMTHGICFKFSGLAYLDLGNHTVCEGDQ